MEIYRRRNCLPQNDQECLLSSIKKLYPKVTEIKTHACYFLWLDESLDEINKRFCQSYLTAEYCDPKNFWNSKQDALVVSREGTKTMESHVLQHMAKACKIQQIKRVTTALQYSITVVVGETLSDKEKKDILTHMHDQASHKVITNVSAIANMYSYIDEAHEAVEIDLDDLGIESLKSMNQQLELELSEEVIERLFDLYANDIKRNPYDLEILSFFDALSIKDRAGHLHAGSSDEMKALKKRILGHPEVMSALEVHSAIYFREKFKNYYRCLDTGMYKERSPSCFTTSYMRLYQDLDTCPYESGQSALGFSIGQASSVGAGSKPIAHTMIIGVAHKFHQESSDSKIPVASARQTLMDTNIGIARYANSIGLPLLDARITALSYPIRGEEYCPSLHKPIVFNKVIGEVFSKNYLDKPIQPGYELIIIGSPVMNVGDVATKLAGGVAKASYNHMHHHGIDLMNIAQIDMQVRCQEVISACSELDDNPISVVEALGEGGITRALLYILQSDKEQNYGFEIQLRNIHAVRNDFTAMQIWGSEMQERYLIICPADKLQAILHFADRERCPYATIGRVIDEPKLRVYDDIFNTFYLDIEHRHLIEQPEGKEPKHQKPMRFISPNTTIENPQDAVIKTLMTTTLGDKGYLTREHDVYNSGRVVSGICIGKKQSSVGYYGLIRQSFIDYAGEIVASSERLSQSLVDPIAASKLAVADVLLRAAAVPCDTLSLEFQWFCDETVPGATDDLSHIIHKVYKEVNLQTSALVCESKVSSKHGIDLEQDGKNYRAILPPSCIVSLSANVKDVRRYTTSYVDNKQTGAKLIWCDLQEGEHNLAGTVLNQNDDKYGDKIAKVDLKAIEKWVKNLQQWVANDKILAYQPVGQGGLIYACSQIMFASGIGINVYYNGAQECLFSDGIGMLLVIKEDNVKDFMQTLKEQSMDSRANLVGEIVANKDLKVTLNSEKIINLSDRVLHEAWAHAAKNFLQSNKNWHYSANDLTDTKLSFTDHKLDQEKWLADADKPKVGLLVEPGTTGGPNIAAACKAVGFKVIEFSLIDIINHHESLLAFAGLIIPNGNAYQAVGKPGRITAMQVLREPKLKKMFTEFFNSPYTFTLAVGDGAHVVSELRSIIPGSGHWPFIKDNTHHQAENRWVMTKVASNTKSVVLDGMQDSIIPLCITLKHGQLYFRDHEKLKDNKIKLDDLLTLQYTDQLEDQADSYPENPTGSMFAMAGFCSSDGKVSALMGLPERGFQSTQMPCEKGENVEYGPWLRLFVNARKWVEDNPQPPIRF